MTQATTVEIPQWKPPAWMNATMRAALRTPLLQRWLGRSTAVLAFSGRRSGRHYEIPISYCREGVSVLVVTKRFRSWWHNFEKPRPVRIRLAGHTYDGIARAVVDDGDKAPLLELYFSHLRRDARLYGLELDTAGRPDPARLAALAPHLIPIEVTLTDTVA